MLPYQPSISSWWADSLTPLSGNGDFRKKFGMLLGALLYLQCGAWSFLSGLISSACSVALGWRAKHCCDGSTDASELREFWRERAGLPYDDLVAPRKGKLSLLETVARLRYANLSRTQEPQPLSCIRFQSGGRYAGNRAGFVVVGGVAGLKANAG